MNRRKNSTRSSATGSTSNACLLCDYLAEETSARTSASWRRMKTSPRWCRSGRCGRSRSYLIANQHCGALTDLDQCWSSRSLADILRRVTARYDNLFEISFPYSMGFHQRPDGRSSARRVALPRALLSAAAALGHGEEVHGGLRDAGRSAARSDAGTSRRTVARAERSALQGVVCVKRTNPCHFNHRVTDEFTAARLDAAPQRDRAGAGPRQPDRRAHRLQRRLRAADGDRSRDLDRAAPAARSDGAGPFARL